MVKITVLGSYNQDITMITPRFPRLKETLKGGRVFMNPGGKGSNQAHAAKMAGGDVFLIAKIGKDPFGDSAIEHFEKSGISTEGILIDNEFSTGSAIILVEEKTKDNRIIVASGANSNIAPKEIDDLFPTIGSCSVMIFQFENNLDAISHAMKRAFEVKITVCLNPAPMITPFPEKLFDYISILILNEIEAADLSGIEINNQQNAIAAGVKLLKKNVKIAIITLGEKGTIAVSKELEDDFLYMPAYNVKVVDTTGAGDAFVGAFAVAYAETEDINHSLEFANACAALNITKMGAASANPTRKEIDEFIITQKS